MLLVVAVFVFVSSDPPIVLFGLFVVYGLSGWFIMAWRWRRARQLNRRRHEAPLVDDTESAEPSFSATHTFQSPELGGQTDKHGSSSNKPYERARGGAGASRPKKNTRIR